MLNKLVLLIIGIIALGGCATRAPEPVGISRRCFREFLSTASSSAAGTSQPSQRPYPLHHRHCHTLEIVEILTPESRTDCQM